MLCTVGHFTKLLNSRSFDHVVIFFQAKTAFEADIDCIQEIADFYRFGIHYAKVVYELDPLCIFLYCAVKGVCICVGESAEIL